MSKSIPFEENLYISDEFEIFSTRIFNKDIDIKLKNVTINIGKNITIQGQNNLNDINKDLNAVDIIVINSYQKNKNESNVIHNDFLNDCNADKYKNISGELSQLSITILINSETNTTKLESNINITWDTSNINSDDIKNLNEIHCVWFDEEHNIWKTNGCQTIIISKNNKNDIVCSCNHLTRFSTIKSISASMNCNNDKYLFKVSKEMNNASFVFLIIFFIISL